MVDSMVIRPSEKDDVHSMSRVYVQTWRDTYLGVSKHVISYVAEDAGGVIGFVSGGYERQADHIYNGEIFALYVLKNYQRQGVGTKLVSALVKQLNQFGIYSMLVMVLEHNPYRRFYEKINGIYLRKHHMPFAGEVLDVAAYGWIDTGLIYH
jgi:GNAT superfamily N-acetyltransferase